MFIRDNPVYVSLTLLVEQVRKMQKSFSEFNRKLDKDVAYLKEFCTVKICTARRSGHTCALSIFVSDEVLSGKNIMYLSFVESHLQLNKRSLEQAVHDVGGKITKSSHRSTVVEGGSYVVFASMSDLGSKADNFPCDKLRGYSLDYIVVDMSSMWSNKRIDAIYRNLGPSFLNSESPVLIFMQ